MQKTLLDAHHHQRFDAERDQFFGRAEFKQLLPQACTISPGHRDLETEFTAEADPRQTHRYLAQVSLPGIHVWESLGRSEEHTSELQSLMRISYAVFCLK